MESKCKLLQFFFLLFSRQWSLCPLNVCTVRTLGVIQITVLAIIFVQCKIRKTSYHYMNAD